MGLFDKISDLFTAEEDDGYEAETSRSSRRNSDSSYGLKDDDSPIRNKYGREAVREPLTSSSVFSRSKERESSPAVDNVISLGNLAAPARTAVERLTQKFKIVVVEPRSFEECPELVDNLKARKPIIINLENIETDTARKIFDFLSGGTYALGGNVQKIAQNIFVFLPANVDIAMGENGESATTFAEFDGEETLSWS